MLKIAKNHKRPKRRNKNPKGPKIKKKMPKRPNKCQKVTTRAKQWKRGDFIVLVLLSPVGFHCLYLGREIKLKCLVSSSNCTGHLQECLTNKQISHSILCFEVSIVLPPIQVLNIQLNRNNSCLKKAYLTTILPLGTVGLQPWPLIKSFHSCQSK